VKKPKWNTWRKTRWPVRFQSQPSCWAPHTQIFGIRTLLEERFFGSLSFESLGAVVLAWKWFWLLSEGVWVRILGKPWMFFVQRKNFMYESMPHFLWKPFSQIVQFEFFKASNASSKFQKSHMETFLEKNLRNRTMGCQSTLICFPPAKHCYKCYIAHRRFASKTLTPSCALNCYDAPLRDYRFKSKIMY
jgi:hypothetical protein